MGKKPQEPTIKKNPTLDEKINGYFRLLFYHIKVRKDLTTQEIADLLGIEKRTFDTYLRKADFNRPNYADLIRMYNLDWPGPPLGLHGRHFNYVVLFKGQDYTEYELRLQEQMKELTAALEEMEVLRDGLFKEVSRQSGVIADLELKLSECEKRLKSGN